MKKLVVLVLIIFQAKLATALTAYNCDNPHIINIFANKAKDDCHLSKRVKNLVEKKSGNLVQIPKYIEYDGYLLQVESRVVKSYCDIVLSNIPKYLATNYIGFSTVKYDRDQLRVAVHAKAMSFEHVQVNLTINKTVTALNTDQLDTEGFCIDRMSTLNFEVIKVTWRQVKLKIHYSRNGNVMAVSVLRRSIDGPNR